MNNYTVFTCPFCGQSNFEETDLAIHLLRQYCENYEEIKEVLGDPTFPPEPRP